MKRLTLFALATCLAVLSVNAQNVFQLKEIKQTKDSELSKKILDYQIVEFDSKALFDFRQQFEHQLSFELKTDAKQSRIFNLQAKEMRSDDYILQVSENGQLKSLKRNKTPVFQGEMDGQDYGSSVFTIDENFVMGFWQEGAIVYYLEPLWRLLPDAPRNQYIIYKGKDIVIPEGFCGLSAETIAEQRKQHQQEQQEQPQEKLIGQCIEVEIALAADFEMVQALGSVASVESFMLGTLGNVQTNYDNEFDDELRYEVVTTFVANSNANDPWTNNNDAGTLLDDFTGWGNAGGFGGVVYDVAAIWTDRNFSGSTIGVAWLASICTNLRYHALERFSTNAALLRVVWAHELGHNFDAPHDGSGGFIMSPSVNSTTTWSTLSLNRINAFVPTRSCLTATCGGGGTEFPISIFSASPQSGCAPLEVEFTDESTGPPDFWEWDFPGGSPSFSSIQNPIVTYTTAGVFDVSLTAFNIEGSDEHTEFDFITVLDVPVPSFTVTVIGFDTDFFNTSTDADFYDWDFGDGNISSEESPLHTYDSPGEYEVTLTVSNDCGSETFTEIIIIESPIFADFEVSENIGCVPLEVDFFDTSDGTPVFWEWDFPGGNPLFSDLPAPFVVYNNAGVYDVSLAIGDDFETDVVTKEGFITVFSNAVADFDVSVTPGNYTPNITNNSIDADNYDWDFGDFGTSTEVNPVHTYTAAGEYTITLVVSNFCGTNTISHTIIITDPIDPSFTISDTLGCAPHTVVFEANPIEEGNTYAWIFEGGDPATSTSSNPTVVYETAGSFDVSLTITNDTGSGTVTQQDAVVVDTLPQAAFTFSNTPGSAEVTFTNTSINIDTSFWDFGDGFLSMMTNPIHTYEAAGIYNTRLIAKNDCGSDTTTMEVTIIFVPEPAIAISATTGCAPLTVSYEASPIAEGNTYAWAFTGGNPTTSTEANPNVVYNNAGTYEASLTVTNIAGSATVTETEILVVNNGPQAAFTSSNTPGSGEVSFTNTSTNADNYQWNFGDDNTSTDENPTHSYESEGTYNVHLITNNECGADTTEMEVTIVFVPEPAIAISATTGCEPLTVSYEASPIVEGNTYAWVFTGGNPATSTEANPSVVYNNAGTYEASLTVTNIAGSATVTETEILVVNNDPQAAFTSSNTPGSGEVSFTNTSTNADSYQWSFGDDNTSTDENPTHSYESEGTYNVHLITNNECGADTTEMEVTIVFVPEPAIAISATTGCEPLTVSYEASPIVEGNTYAWVFTGGNPATSTEANPSVVYNNAGTYEASLTVTNIAGSATVTEAEILVISANPEVSFTIANLGSGEISFTNQSNNAASYSWDFGDENTSTDANPTHTYTEEGTYTAVLTATNECGSDESTMDITIIFPPTATIEASVTEGCVPQVVDFQTPVVEGYTYEWSFSGGEPASSSDPNVSVTYNEAGNFTAILTVINAVGISGTSTIIRIDAAPTTAFTFEVNGLTANFTNTSTNATSYSWDIAGTIVDEENPSFVFPGVGEYDVILTAENDCGSNQFSATIIVEGRAPFASFVAENNEGCTPLEVNFTSAIEDADSFEWIFEGGDPATSGAANPNIIYTEPGVYNVTLIATNVFGTTAFSLPDVVIVNAQTIAGFSFDINGATAQFQNTSTAANTIEWLFPDGSTSSENSLDFTFPGNGVYDVTLAAEGLCNADTETQTITVDGALPVIEIESDKQSGCLPFTVTFTDLSTESPTSRTWAFPGGNPATSDEQSVEVTYASVGVYPVSLTVANEFGSIQQDWTDFITIIDVPEVPDFTMNTIDNFNGEATVIDPNAAYTYSWDFGNGQTATGQSATYNYTEEGTYTVSLTATNDCGETIATQEFVAILDGVNTPLWASSLALFPNPTQGNIQLVAKGWPASGKIGLSLINVLGQKMEQLEFEVASGQWNQSFDWHHLPAGTYMLQLNWGAEVWSQKVIKL